MLDLETKFQKYWKKSSNNLGRKVPKFLEDGDVKPSCEEPKIHYGDVRGFHCCSGMTDRPHDMKCLSAMMGWSTILGPLYLMTSLILSLISGL